MLHHCSRFKNWFRFWNPVVWARPQTGSPQDYSFKELFVIQCFRWVTELWNQPHTHHRWSDHSTGQMTIISFKKHIPDASEQLIDSRITQIAPRSSRFCPLSVVRSLILWPQVELQRSLYCLEQLFKLNIFHRSHRFTPDFTSSRVIRELKLVTCGGSEFVFVLNASLPYHMLAACAESLPRPSWELELYIIVSLIMRWVSLQNLCCSIKRAPPQLFLCLLSFMFLLVIATAYLEAQSIWEPFKRRVSVESNSSLETGRPFNLREIVQIHSDSK